MRKRTKSKRKLSFQENEEDAVENGTDPDTLNQEIEVENEDEQDQNSPQTSNQSSPTRPVEIDIYEKASKTFLMDRNVGKTLAKIVFKSK